LNGFYIIKSIVRKHVDLSRVVFRDSQSYFSVLLDDNNRKPICRLWLNGVSKKYIGVFDNEKKEVRIEIETLDDIYSYSNEILESLRLYLKDS